MVALSKPTLLQYSCYELGHTWTPSCRKASFDVALLVLKESLKIYGSLYFIAGLVRRRGKAYFRKKFWQELLRSTFFLTTNGTLFIACFCLWRRFGGRLYYVNTISFLPCVVASIIAILQERKSRRGLLAVYMANVAVETVWRMLKARGWVRSLPNGEVLLFSVAASVYLYYFRKAGGLPDGTLSIFKKIFGSEETAAFEETVPSDRDDTDINRNDSSHNCASVITNQKKPYEPVVRWLKKCPRHALCKHKYGCVYYVLQGSLKMFGVGYAVQGAIKVISSLSHVFKQPKSVIKALVHRNNFQLGAFLASFVGIYRALNCLLRWVREKDDEIHGMVAGFLAGWSMLFYKSQTIALYTAAKLAEMMYFKGISSGKVPYIQCADIIIYSISTALVFHAAVLEPHNLRPAYWNFLLRVTGNKFATMNRRLLDPWVPNCSKLFPDHWPDYDMRYTNLVKPAS